MLGSAAIVGAIERPGKNGETVPAEPQGGILGSQAAGRDSMAPAPGARVGKKIAYLGVGGEPISDALKMHLDLEEGLLLSTVDPTGPAELSGLKENDIILSLGKTGIKDQESLRKVVAKHEPGDEVVLKLVRRGKEIEQELALGVPPVERGIRPMALVPDPAAQMNRMINPRLGLRLGGMGDGDFREELLKQLRKAFGDEGFAPGLDGEMQQLKLQFDQQNAGGLKGFQKFGSVRLQDGRGSVEMKMEDGKRKVIVRDREGTIQFEGPYNTEVEKKAVPAEFQDRVKRLDGEDSGSALRFQFGGFPPRPDEKQGE